MSGTADNAPASPLAAQPASALPVFVKRPRTFLSIVKFRQVEYRHGERHYPWIKFYDDLLDNPSYRGLSKSQRADYCDLLLLANRFNNMIPEDEGTLAFLLRSNDPLDVQALVAAGLVCRSRAGKRAAAGRQTAATEEMRSEQTQKKKKTEKETVPTSGSRPRSQVPPGTPAFARADFPPDVLGRGIQGNRVRCRDCTDWADVESPDGVALCHGHNAKRLRALGGALPHS